MTIFVRYNGRSYEVPYARLDLIEAGRVADRDLKLAVERLLELPKDALAEYEVDRYADVINIRPQARFG